MLSEKVWKFALELRGHFDTKFSPKYVAIKKEGKHYGIQHIDGWNRQNKKKENMREVEEK